MGQSQSDRSDLMSSDDRINLFVPCRESVSSLASDPSSDTDAVVRSFHRTHTAHTHSTHHTHKSCRRKLSKLKKSFSECFRSRFRKLREVDDDDSEYRENEGERAEEAMTEREGLPRTQCSVADKDGARAAVAVTDRRARHSSDTSALFTDTIPRDIQEIHVQLRELKTLLSRPDIVSESLEKRDVSCQTTKADLNFEHLLKQKDVLIANQADQLNNLKVSLENKTRIAETFAKELSVLRSQQSRRSLDIEPKTLDQFVSLLKSIRLERKLEDCDMDKLEEGIAMITSLSLLNRTQLDKANVAIINPCSKTVADGAKDDSFPHLNIPLNREESLNPFLTDTKNIMERQETKLIFFIGKSPIPYSSVIPKQSASITLAQVKECTQSLLSKDGNFRYFFKSITKDFGATKEEIIQDGDRVPIVDGKIVVFIQQ